MENLEQELAAGVAAADAARKRKRGGGSGGMAVAPKSEDGGEDWKEDKEGLEGESQLVLMGRSRWIKHGPPCHIVLPRTLLPAS